MYLHTKSKPIVNVMRKTQEDFYFNLVLFMFASQLYFYAFSPSSLLRY